MARYEIQALLGGIAVSRYDSLTSRLATLDRELPQLASLCAEWIVWRCVVGERVVDTACPMFLAYRNALLEYNDIQTELVSIGAFLAA